VAVKVHDRFRSGPIAAYVEGIMYAADNDADVIHLSIPASFNKREHPGLVAAINRATSYAYRKGAVIIAAAGNSMPPVLPTDFDHDQDGFKFCNAVHVLCVSATAPTSAAGREGPWANWDDAAPYSFYGRSTINVAGPGGGPIGTRIAATAVPLACSHWSHKFSDGLGRCSKGTAFWGNDPVWYSTGTSFGAAATSGLAALLVSMMGHGQPSQIRAVIEKSADDLGQPGTDPYYGKGRINVARAIELLH
jgi:hypothetical protein